MSQYQRLLLIINPALRHSPAINHAAALAKASGASLHIAALVKPLEILSLLDEGVQEKARESYLQDHRDWLKNQATNLNALGLKVTTEVMWADDMKQDILDHVTEMQPDLLIKEVQHESALKRAFFTPLDWHLLRHCPIPVYLVGGGGHALPRKVVAAVDASDAAPADSELNERIIQQATNLALQCDAELHLLYACDLSGVYLADMGGLALPDITKELRTTEEQSFSKLAGRYGVPSDRRHFVLGHPVAALSDFANEQQVDVIVMGRVQYHGLEKLLGSTTEHILYQVPCSVLAV
ncbi:MAG: universal stress protein [Gammaproteobacteria bacterium]|jgi:universal stress protein E|uniref:universal stress protein n=1 Tax=Pseudomonas sp. SW-3 TaxID=147212 RepID=UPI00190C7831|nr:universal stress protein [Pseudomonas sp. SW-3]MBU0522616.1 universal stress protein [Gammaproteobacteria bacterium]MBU0821965.1 universal stress protein [Gammaproteobacteria bacterium]MBU0844078.1 universal stress protein [Gammaproteobacteria bacterium]MBU1842329.1 universal stress protein [Gammaproteobacteria bacterium]QQN96346.1 universal stress protein [Pseudomonas sp. SW-3]